MALGQASSTDALLLPESLAIRAKGIRPNVRTVREALGLIDDELPNELRGLPPLIFARALLIEAEKTRKKRDLVRAVRQLKQVLENEGWLLLKSSAGAPADAEH